MAFPTVLTPSFTVTFSNTIPNTFLLISSFFSDFRESDQLPRSSTCSTIMLEIVIKTIS